MLDWVEIESEWLMIEGRRLLFPGQLEEGAVTGARIGVLYLGVQVFEKKECIE